MSNPAVVYPFASQNPLVVIRNLLGVLTKMKRGRSCSYATITHILSATKLLQIRLPRKLCNSQLSACNSDHKRLPQKKLRRVT